MKVFELKDVDLSFLGWGFWVGVGIKFLEVKKKRFIKKVDLVLF